jgi:hypothetical protein
MISLPRGVADSLAPHPDVEIEPVVARRENKTTPQLNAGTLLSTTGPEFALRAGVVFCH